METEDRLAEAINSDPVVFMECTLQEIIICAITGTIFGVLFSIVVAVAISIMIGMIIGVLVMVGCTWLGMTFIQSIRGKYYENWLSEQIFLKKRGLGLSSRQFINESRRFGRGQRRG